MWEIRQSVMPKALDLYIYSDVEPDGYDWWMGETVESETSATHFKRALEEAGAVESINVYINSYGGSVKEGLAIYNQLKRHPAKKTVYIDGFACSIASVIAMSGDVVIMPRNTAMAIHNASIGAWGTSAELRKAADDLDVINEASCNSYLMKAGDKLTKETLRPLLDAETWLTAERCVELGLADKIADEEADLETAKAMLNQAKQSAKAQFVRRHEAAARARMGWRPAGEPGGPAEQTPFQKAFAAFYKEDE